MKALIGALAVVSSAVPVGLAALLMGAAASGSSSQAPSAEALQDIPGPLVAAYQRAASGCPGLPWPVLAAIGKVETEHGRFGGATLGANGDVAPPIVGVALDGSADAARIGDSDGGRLDGDTTFDRAVGPMQFLPGTWQRWGRDANGDGVADPHNALDAIAGAAAYLCGADGEVADLDAAVLSYNRSTTYLEEVMAVAAGYGSLSLVGSLGADVEAVLANPRLTITESARRDLESGLVDPRVVAVLDAIGQRFVVGVGVIKTGHSQCVGGGSRQDRPRCSVSDHWDYRGVDLYAVNGAAVSPANSHARALAEHLLRLSAALRPDSLGLPWAEMEPIPGVFSDANHQSHLHVSYSTQSRPV